MSLEQCTKCGATESEAFAHLGSYVLRCAKCGHPGVTTSLMSILRHDGITTIRAEVDPRGDRRATLSVASEVLGISPAEAETLSPLVEGPPDEAAPKILRICGAGGALLIDFSFE